jgi:hypothetical protein
MDQDPDYALLGGTFLVYTSLNFGSSPTYLLSTIPPVMAPTATRKVRVNTASCKPHRLRKKAEDTPKTSANPGATKTCKNLTLHDWLTVFRYIDMHPDLSQDEIVSYFWTRADGTLMFTQATLSRKLAMRPELEGRVNDNPSALSSKRPRVVTRPDVERALVLWVKHMEEKNEGVSGAMLVAKRQIFEDSFNVPEDERLHGDKWVDSFKRAYKLKEHRKHGEAASASVEVVEAERARVQGILANYHLRDRFNFDEFGFFTS